MQFTCTHKLKELGNSYRSLAKNDRKLVNNRRVLKQPNVKSSGLYIIENLALQQQPKIRALPVIHLYQGLASIS